MTFEEEWKLAADKLGLSIVVPFQLQLASGNVVQARVLLKNFGAQKGMLLVTDNDRLSGHEDELWDAGYGYSCYEEDLAQTEFDRQSTIELLKDWSWSGPPAECPQWL